MPRVMPGPSALTARSACTTPNRALPSTAMKVGQCVACNGSSERQPRCFGAARPDLRSYTLTHPRTRALISEHALCGIVRSNAVGKRHMIDFEKVADESRGSGPHRHSCPPHPSGRHRAKPHCPVITVVTNPLSLLRRPLPRRPRNLNPSQGGPRRSRNGDGRPGLPELARTR